MDIPADILDVLKCSSCEMYLSRGPVYLQHDGAAVCGRCYSPKRPATRNTHYEATAKLLKYPCKNQEVGCPKTVPFVDEADVIAHEEVCEHRQYVCPMLGSARCDWLGSKTDMLAHCRDQHPDLVLENPCSLTHDIARSSLNNYLISAFQMLFLLHIKVCVANGKIYHGIRLLERSAEAANYFFILDIKRGIEQVSKVGQVAPQGCLAIQEDSSLPLDTNGLLAVLGGFDGATFSVTVKRRVSDAADQLARTLEKCGRCKAEVTDLLYRDENGWRCKRCTPARRACENQLQGCRYTDISNKCHKHEWYYCQESTTCYICKAAVSPGTLTAHYESAHQNITHQAGTTWWTSEIEEDQWCLVSSAAGIAVCDYYLNKSQFSLDVCTPVPSERLREFRCTVQVTDPATGHVHTFTPDALYNKFCDWRIIINKDNFPSWNVAFDVCVDIAKI